MACDNLNVLEGGCAECGDAGQRVIEYGVACNSGSEAGDLVKKRLTGCEVVACTVDDQTRKNGRPARSAVGLLEHQ